MPSPTVLAKEPSDQSGAKVGRSSIGATGAPRAAGVPGRGPVREGGLRPKPKGAQGMDLADLIRATEQVDPGRDMAERDKNRRAGTSSHGNQ